jgi:hypothetical protein
MFRICAAVTLCAVILCILAVPKSRATPEQEQPNIRVAVNEVIVPVTVTDDRGKFVSNLEAKDFRVLDWKWFGTSCRATSATRAT